jgi:hypothetical protein
MLKGSKIAAANGNIVFSFIGLFFDFGMILHGIENLGEHKN